MEEGRLNLRNHFLEDKLQKKTAESWPVLLLHHHWLKCGVEKLINKSYMLKQALELFILLRTEASMLKQALELFILLRTEASIQEQCFL